MRATCSLRFALFMAVLLSPPGTLTAQNFRIESEVFLGKEKEPVSESLTLFHGGVVYDFLLTAPEEISVFDPLRSRFVLLDVTRRVKATLTLDDLQAATEAIKTGADAKQHEYFLSPQFEQTFDAETLWLTLTSKHIIYRVKGITPRDAEAVERYQLFADWYARLNATRPGNLPPFARIELDRALAQRRLVPEEVELTLLPKNRLLGRKIELHSKHAFIWELGQTDFKRIETAGQYLATFETVSFQRYREPSGVAARAGR
jgi:hypothetical protein